MSRGKQRELLNFDSKRLRLFVWDYCQYYNGNLGSFAKALKELGIKLPANLKNFDGENSFYIENEKRVVLKHHQETFFPVIIIQEGNVEKYFECNFHNRSQVTVKLKKVKINENCTINLQQYICEIEIPEETIKIPLLPNVKEYLNNLSCSAETYGVVGDLINMK